MTTDELVKRAREFAHIVEDCGSLAVWFDIDGINTITLLTSDILALCDAVEALQKRPAKIVVEWCVFRGQTPAGGPWTGWREYLDSCVQGNTAVLRDLDIRASRSALAKNKGNAGVE